MNTAKKIVFLMGAGASVSAGCKTTSELTDVVLKQFSENEEAQKQFPWIKRLWVSLEAFSKRYITDENIKWLAGSSGHSIQRFIPTYEELLYTIELLREDLNADSFNLNDRTVLDNLNSVNLPSIREPILSLYHVFSRISLSHRDINPMLQNIHLEGATMEYLQAFNSITRYLAQVFPREYIDDHLEPFCDLLKDDKYRITVATTNHDLVLEQLVEKNNIDSDDGFTVVDGLGIWKGFDEHGEKPLILKLHGSLDWYHIHESWFKLKPGKLSQNNVYKIISGNTSLPLLKDEYVEKHKNEGFYRSEFDVPHIIAGGAKDKKIYEVPYVDLFTEWQRSLRECEVIVLVGHGLGDYHLKKQMQGMLMINNNLKRIVIVNHDVGAIHSSAAFLKSAIYARPNIRIYGMDHYWDPSEWERKGRMSLKGLIDQDDIALGKYFSKPM